MGRSMWSCRADASQDLMIAKARCGCRNPSPDLAFKDAKVLREAPPPKSPIARIDVIGYFVKQKGIECLLSWHACGSINCPAYRGQSCSISPNFENQIGGRDREGGRRISILAILILEF